MIEDLSFADPPYNVHGELGRQKSDYGLLSKDDIAKVELCGEHLKFGGHAHLF